MPRKPRVHSATSIYHVIIRGNNKQPIFEDSEDYLYFKHRLLFYKDKCDCKIYAYCLMSNHVHLLIKSGPDGISSFMKRLSNSYVYWFNNKYRRIGHLFQDRFKSEPVESESYFKVVLRYIHNNPVKAGIVSHCKDYPYSSYSEYMHTSSIADTKFALELFDRKTFSEYHSKPNNDSCLELVEKNTWQLTDSDAIVLIKNLFPSIGLSSFISLAKSIRNSCIQTLRQKGLSINQISRLTGISFSIVARAMTFPSCHTS